LPGKNDHSTIYITVGLLDTGYQDLAVKHHLFVGSKAEWEKIGDDGLRHLNNFPSYKIDK